MLMGRRARDDLSWFHGLVVDDQIALLRNPHEPIRAELANYIAASIGERPAMRRQVLRRGASNRNARCWELAEPAVRQLREVRGKLDAWWDSESLTYNERKYLIRHGKDGEPPAHAHAVMVEPAMIRAYLEMKAGA